MNERPTEEAMMQELRKVLPGVGWQYQGVRIRFADGRVGTLLHVRRGRSGGPLFRMEDGSDEVHSWDELAERFLKEE